MPPVGPPVDLPLPTGSGTLSAGDWILSPQLGLYTLYDTNVHSSPTNALSGPGFRFHPSLMAENNSGIYDTRFYGSIDSKVYPTLPYQENTFDKRAGFVQTYSPTTDLVFKAEGDYAHSTTTNVVQESLASPIVSGGGSQGAAGVTGEQQTVVKPNDVYTLTGSMYKEFNRAFVTVGGVLQSEIFSTDQTSNYNRASYHGAGGFWFSPILYAFGDGIQSFTSPETGAPSNYFRARAGVGTAQLGFFHGTIYYGQQGSEVNGGGSAGGDIYGGDIIFVPNANLNMSFAVSRLRNISNITSGATQGLGGLEFSGVGVTAGTSVQSTVLAFKADYIISPQTTSFLVVTDTLLAHLSGPPGTDKTWLVSVGIDHSLSEHLSVAFSYNYTQYLSETPNSSYTRNLVTAGAHYRF